jgi:DNA-binding transcriptional LysR family regulator
MVELEQMRTLDVVRGVADGRLDFGIVLEDSLPPEVQRRRLGSVGYALFGANDFLEGLSHGA